jgi:hypothetical protein
MIQIEITHRKITQLAKDAPALCRQHLLDLSKAADDRGDVACSTIILEKNLPISKRERSSIRLITPLNHHKEAMPFQSMFSPDQL